MSDWAGVRVSVPGGAGFIGSRVVARLRELGADVTVPTRSPDEGLPGGVRAIEADVSTPAGADAATRGQQVVLNLAAKVADIGFNSANHDEMFAANVALQSHLTRAAADNGVERFLVVSSACVYPDDAHVPTPEPEGERGLPEAANRGYGAAKRLGEELGRLYHESGRLRVAVCRPFNVYGPGDRVAHVIPALVGRALRGEDPFVVWGSGKQARTFLHVRDAAEGMLQIAAKATDPSPINLGSQEEITIADLVARILSLTGRSPEVVFDTTKPEGVVRRGPDCAKLERVTGWRPTVPLDEGLQEVIHALRA